MHDKLDAITLWLEPLLAEHRQSSSREAFVLGVSGVQGSGKSTLVANLEAELVQKGYGVAQVSLDDLYKTHIDQIHLAESSDMSLWQSRGQFGTHDLELAGSVYSSLKAATTADSKARIPRYDKSLHSGRGDRMPEDAWSIVSGPLDIVILEGWGVGFQAVDEDELRRVYDIEGKKNDSQTAKHSFKDIAKINSALQEYNQVFMGPRHFDALVVLHAQKTQFVYTWRLEQEHAMWKIKKSGMTDDEVKAFVDRYYPSYELYLKNSVQGIFQHDKAGRQMNLKMDKHRALVDINII